MPLAYANLGGRGLTSKIVSEEVPPRTDALDMENKLVFAPGILAATPAPNNSRLSVGGKSPLTGTIKEANSGGAAAQKLARLGIQGIVVEGAASALTMVKVTKDGVTFIPAEGFKGMGNYDLIDKLKAEHGDSISIIAIGPGGEKLLKAASVSVTSPDFKIRMASSRGGLGAVMGSKKLKAIIVDDTNAAGIEVNDGAKLKEAAGDLTKGILTHPLMEGLKVLGTPLLVNMINGAGCLPTKNYSVGQFEGAEKISGEFMMESQAKRPNSQATHRCMAGCVISCSNVYTDEAGKEIVSGLEYETLGLVGSNCMISNLDDIAHINRLLWYFAAIDSLGICLFASLPLLDMPDLMKHLIACATAVTGQAPDENYLMNLGISVLKSEKKFNEAAGFTTKDDRLPKFFTKEQLPPSGLVFDVPEAEIDSSLQF